MEWIAVGLLVGVICGWLIREDIAQKALRELMEEINELREEISESRKVLEEFENDLRNDSAKRNG